MFLLHLCRASFFQHLLRGSISVSLIPLCTPPHLSLRMRRYTIRPPEALSTAFLAAHAQPAATASKAGVGSSATASCSHVARAPPLPAGAPPARSCEPPQPSEPVMGKALPGMFIRVLKVYFLGNPFSRQ